MRWILLTLLLFSTGCGYVFVHSMMDKMMEHQLKLMEEERKDRELKRKEVSQIEGVVLKLEYRDVEVVDLDSEPKKESKRDGNVVLVEVKTPKKKQRKMIVIFEDGREKEFVDTPSIPLESGKYYVIKYNGMNEFLEIKIGK